MKILFVLDQYYPHVGGVETLFKNLAENLVKEGNECCILTTKINKTNNFEIIKGVKISRISVPKKADKYWFAFFSIPKAIKLGKWADVIHTTTYTSAFPSFISAKINRKKSIITVHEIFLKMWKNFPMDKLSSFFHRLAEKAVISLPFDKYICVSDYTRYCLRLTGIPDNKLLTIYNGLDYTNIKSNNSINIKTDLNLKDKFVYLYFGRPGVSKGVEYLIKASKIIKKEIKWSKLILILTKDPLNRYNDILSLIGQSNLKEHIIILDSLDKIKLNSYIKTSDCVVIPSISEGFGYALAEACYLETPVVATNVGAIPEVISGKYVLVEPSNPQSIAEGIIKVHNNRYYKTPLKKFDIKETIKNYMEVYGK